VLGKPISPRTIGRILGQDSIKPWRYEHWIFPRDPMSLRFFCDFPPRGWRGKYCFLKTEDSVSWG